MIIGRVMLLVKVLLRKGHELGNIETPRIFPEHKE